MEASAAAQAIKIADLNAQINEAEGQLGTAQANLAAAIEAKTQAEEGAAAAVAEMEAAKTAETEAAGREVEATAGMHAEEAHKVAAQHDAAVALQA